MRTSTKCLAVLAMLALSQAFIVNAQRELLADASADVAVKKMGAAIKAKGGVSTAKIDANAPAMAKRVKQIASQTTRLASAAAGSGLDLSPLLSLVGGLLTTVLGLLSLGSGGLGGLGLDPSTILNGLPTPGSSGGLDLGGLTSGVAGGDGGALSGLLGGLNLGNLLGGSSSVLSLVTNLLGGLGGLSGSGASASGSGGLNLGRKMLQKGAPINLCRLPLLAPTAPGALSNVNLSTDVYGLLQDLNLSLGDLLDNLLPAVGLGNLLTGVVGLLTGVVALVLGLVQGLVGGSGACGSLGSILSGGLLAGLLGPTGLLNGLLGGLLGPLLGGLGLSQLLSALGGGVGSFSGSVASQAGGATGGSAGGLGSALGPLSKLTGGLLGR